MTGRRPGALAHLSAVNYQHGASGRRQAGYSTPLLAGKPISRPCPKCDAEPGRPCRRRSNGRVRGEDIGGGYVRLMNGFHAERRGGASS